MIGELCDVSVIAYRAHLHTESLAEQSGDPYLTVEPSCDARPAVVGRRPVGARSVPLMALERVQYASDIRELR